MKRLIGAISLLFFATSAQADQGAVSMVNELLRGELSAVETYRQALEKVGDVKGSEQLRKFHEDHQMAASKLRDEVTRLGGKPSTDSGAWGTWAKTVMGSAKILGDEAALKALKEGEEHGAKEYKELLENKNTPVETKQLVQDNLLPKQHEHIQAIDQLMNVNG